MLAHVSWRVLPRALSKLVLLLQILCLRKSVLILIVVVAEGRVRLVVWWNWKRHLDSRGTTTGVSWCHAYVLIATGCLGSRFFKSRIILWFPGTGANQTSATFPRTSILDSDLVVIFVKNLSIHVVRLVCVIASLKNVYIEQHVFILIVLQMVVFIRRSLLLKLFLWSDLSRRQGLVLQGLRLVMKLCWLPESIRIIIVSRWRNPLSSASFRMTTRLVFASFAVYAAKSVIL